jgi:predicted ATPase
MITRLEVDGFKSLRDFAVDLDLFTVLIGPNSAGKSNILDALALLSRLSSMSLDDAFKQGRGKAIDQFTRRGGEAGTAIRLAVELFILPVESDEPGSPRLPNRLRYEVAIERHALPSGAERLAIKDERLALIDPAADPWMTAHPALAAKVEYGQGPREVLKHLRESARQRILMTHSEAEAEISEYRVPRTHTAIAAHGANLGKAILQLLLSPDEIARLDDLQRAKGLPTREEAARYVIEEATKQLGADSKPTGGETDSVASDLASYRPIHIDPAVLRSPSERLGSDILAPDASNLPTVLANLPPPLLGAIRADLVSLVPGIASFDVVPEGDTFRIDFELSSGERLPARLASDGTLRIVALLTALQVEPRSSVISVEEPENGVYPGRLRKLVDYLRATTIPSDRVEIPPQIIVTTHSPVLVAALRSQPEHLRVVDLVRRDGQLVSRARAVGPITSPDQGRRVASLREIDELLHAADAEGAP